MQYIASIGMPVRTLENASSGSGASFAMPARASQLTWQTVYGSAPSAVLVNLEMSNDEGASWQVVDSTNQPSGEVRTFSKIGGGLIRASIASIVGGGPVTVILSFN